MTTLQNRSGSALLVVDVQNAVVAQAFRRDAVVANIATLVEQARREGVPVVWVQHSDEELVEGSDGHTTEDQTAWVAPEPQQVIAHTNLYWAYETGVGRTAATVETKDASFGGH